MITNERQYKITRNEAGRFERALAEFDDSPREGVHPLMIQAERDALASQLDDLRIEIEEYESLKSTDPAVISLGSFDELAEGLIKARIAARLSQKELASRVGLKEQQIQRYESERYASASFHRLRDIAGAIGVRIENNILMPVAPRSFEGLIRKLGQVGLDRDFLTSKLMSTSDAAFASGEANIEDEDVLSSKVGETLGRVFGWSPATLFGPQPLSIPRFAAAEARFKMPARRSSTTTSLYAAYANYLAIMVLKASRELKKAQVPQDAAVLRAELLRRYPEVSLRSVLNYAWDLGIPVIPLRDAGTFHGACWRYEGRNVVVLKQNSKHESRWIFDLIHELFHAGQNEENETLEVIEADETAPERRESDEEIAASQFAGDVVLDGRAEELAQACVTAANGSVERLKKAVADVAASQSVSVGALANYMAFRLSWQGINWWGAAANLQENDGDPWATGRDVFLERFSFSFDSDVDRQLLNRALQ